MTLGVALFLVAYGQPGLVQTIAWPATGGLVDSLPRIVVRQPTHRIGSATGAEYSLFNGVAGAVRLADGALVVGDAGNNRVLFFTAAGIWRRTIGGKGDGPGEFRQPRWLGRCGHDRIGYLDGVHGRMTLFTLQGEFAGTTNVPAGLGFDLVLQCASDGRRLLMLMNQPHGPIQRGSYMEVPVALIRTQDTAVDTLHRAGVRDFYFGRSVSVGGPAPLGRDAQAAAGSTVLFLCENRDGSCEVFDSTGRPTGHFALGLPQRPVRRGEWKAALDQHYVGESSRWYRLNGPKIFPELTPQKAFPRFDQLRADREDRLWVRTYDGVTTAYATWVVYASSGVPQMVVAVPRGLHLLDLGRHYLLGMTRDNDDVERIELYVVPAP